MKAAMYEDGGEFTIKMSAETVPEAAMLVRFAVNRTNTLRLVDTAAYKGDAGIETFVCVTKRKNSQSGVPRAK